MSIHTETNRVQYSGNGFTDIEYHVPFYFLEPADIRVVLTDPTGQDRILTPFTDYTVRMTSDGSGGGVTTTQAWNTLHKVTIIRQVAATQTTSYEENAEFPAKSHERALDKLTMLAQQVGRRVLSSLRIRDSDGEIPEVPATPSSLIGFGGDRRPRTMTADQVATWLNMTQAFFGQGTITFLDAADRNSTAPQFLGQIGVQLDTLSIYTAYDTSAGAWGAPISGIADQSITTATLALNALAATSAGRARMEDGFLTLAKIANEAFTSDSAGRAKFQEGFVNSSLCASNLWTALAPNGAVLQSATDRYTSRAPIPGRIPEDDTVPEKTEGIQILSVTITPTLATSTILLNFQGLICDDISAGTASVIALFGPGTQALATTSVVSYYYLGYPGVITHAHSPGVTTPVTYTIRVGKNSGNVYANRYSASADRFGSTMGCTLTAQEIKA